MDIEAPSQLGEMSERFAFGNVGTDRPSQEARSNFNFKISRISNGWIFELDNKKTYAQNVRELLVTVQDKMKEVFSAEISREGENV
jgi:hypothetical protein